MKVAEAICSAMPWAASSSVPTQPIITEAAPKRLTSDSQVSPIGQPRRKTRAKTSQSGRQMLRRSSVSGVAAQGVDQKGHGADDVDDDRSDGGADRAPSRARRDCRR